MYRTVNFHRLLLGGAVRLTALSSAPRKPLPHLRRVGRENRVTGWPRRSAEEDMHFSKRRSNSRWSWISLHAKERVAERCSLSATSVRAMIDEGRCVWLGEASAGRGQSLLYSRPDDRCFVVVQDLSNGAVITVLPLWMWNRGTLLESSPQANEARRLAPEPKSHHRQRNIRGYQPQRPRGVFRRRR